MLVIDASAVVEMVLGQPAATTVEGHVAAAGFQLHAPHLIDLEVLNTLRRLVARGGAREFRAGEAIEDLLDLPIERHPHLLLERVWELRDNFTAYDAAYVALAEGLASPLLTADTRLARAVNAHTGVRVLLAD